MFENLDLLTLQHYWWIIVSLLGSMLVFLMFVQGGQTLIYVLGRTAAEQKVLLNVFGRKWELTFTTLVTFGGAFFASFPLFYATSFGGAYWIWMILLFSFILQAVSYEFRSKPANFLGRRTFEVFLLINGIVGTFMIGTVLSTFFTGAEFSVNNLNLTDPANPVISRWTGPAKGLEAVTGWRNILLGLSVFFLARVLGILYILNSVDDERINERCRPQLWINAIPFLALFITYMVILMLSDGFAVDPVTGYIYAEPYKYWKNMVQMPPVAMLFLLGVFLILAGIFLSCLPFKKFHSKGIWAAGSGTVCTVFSLLLLAGFNHTAYYPSVSDLQSSLTIANSSSGKYTLVIMSYVSLLVPFVAAYIFHAWRSINKYKITRSEAEEDEDMY